MSRTMLTNKACSRVPPVPQSSNGSPGQSLVRGVSQQTAEEGELHGQRAGTGRTRLCGSICWHASTQVHLR